MKIAFLLFVVAMSVFTEISLLFYSCDVKKTNTVSKFNNEWKRAKFGDLTMGISTIEDVLRSFGKPEWEGFPDGASESDVSPEWWIDYDSFSHMDSLGKLTFISDKKSRIVLAVIFNPLNLNKSQIIRHFGKNFSITRYAFEPCDEANGGAARLYETIDGQLESLEYRSKGVAITFDPSNKEKVTLIEYLSQPKGAKVSQCKKKPVSESKVNSIPSTHDIRKWISPEVLGLKLGKSTLKDVRRLFGKPIWEGSNQEKVFTDEAENEILVQYRNVAGIDAQFDPVLLDFIIGKKTKIVKALAIYTGEIRRITCLTVMAICQKWWISTELKMKPRQ